MQPYNKQFLLGKEAVQMLSLPVVDKERLCGVPGANLPASP